VRLTPRGGLVEVERRRERDSQCGARVWARSQQRLRRRGRHTGQAVRRPGRVLARHCGKRAPLVG
jgi:hypothetical protein